MHAVDFVPSSTLVSGEQVHTCFLVMTSPTLSGAACTKHTWPQSRIYVDKMNANTARMPAWCCFESGKGTAQGRQEYLVGVSEVSCLCNKSLQFHVPGGLTLTPSSRLRLCQWPPVRELQQLWCVGVPLRWRGSLCARRDLQGCRHGAHTAEIHLDDLSTL